MNKQKHGKGSPDCLTSESKGKYRRTAFKKHELLVLNGIL